MSLDSLELWKQLSLKDLCRCCHSHAQTKSLFTPVIWLQKERIVLADLLMECFNIELSPVNKPLSHIVCTICNTCIKRLQEAVIFKRQVQKCEEQFKEHYADFLGKVSSFEVVVKQEFIEDEDNDNKDFFKDISRTAVKEENENTEANVRSIEKANNQSMKKVKSEQKKITDDDDDGLSDPWDDICGNITGTNKKDASEETPEIQYIKKTKFSKGVDFKRIDGQFQCCRCDNSYRSYRGFTCHFRRIHVKKYTCAQCSQIFFDDTSFVNHKLNEHNIVDDRLKCNACDKIFTTKDRLTHHMNNYHMLGVKRKCDHCNFETYSRISMFKHKYVHKTVKNYHCPYCKKSFVRNSTLNLHVKIHTGDKRKVCNECGKAFVQKASLNYHMAKYHPGVPF